MKRGSPVTFVVVVRCSCLRSIPAVGKHKQSSTISIFVIIFLFFGGVRTNNLSFYLIYFIHSKFSMNKGRKNRNNKVIYKSSTTRKTFEEIMANEDNGDLRQEVTSKRTHNKDQTTYSGKKSRVRMKIKTFYVLLLLQSSVFGQQVMYSQTGIHVHSHFECTDFTRVEIEIKALVEDIWKITNGTVLKNKGDAY